MNKLIVILSIAALTACGPVHSQPGNKPGPNADVRTINGMGLWGGNVADAAARACDAEKKKLNVITTTTQTGITGTSYPVIVFKCE